MKQLIMVCVLALCALIVGACVTETDPATDEVTQGVGGGSGLQLPTVDDPTDIPPIVRSNPIESWPGDILLPPLEPGEIPEGMINVGGGACGCASGMGSRFVCCTRVGVGNVVFARCTRVSACWLGSGGELPGTVENV